MNPDPPTEQLSGVAGPAEQQARYFQLMKQGWNNNDACRAVGICRKTGTRWRLSRTETKNGHTHSYPAVEPITTTGNSKRFLSEQERVRIADLHRGGKSMRFIAAEMGGPCRRSAGNCFATATRPGTGTSRTPRTGLQQRAGSGPKTARG